MRQFKNKGNKQAALEALYSSDTAMDKARALAKFHAQVRWAKCVVTFLFVKLII